MFKGKVGLVGIYSRRLDVTSIMIAYSSLLLFVECLAEEMNCEFEESWSRKCHMFTRACHEDNPVRLCPKLTIGVLHRIRRYPENAT